MFCICTLWLKRHICSNQNNPECLRENGQSSGREGSVRRAKLNFNTGRNPEFPNQYCFQSHHDVIWDQYFQINNDVILAWEEKGPPCCRLRVSVLHFTPNQKNKTSINARNCSGTNQQDLERIGLYLQLHIQIKPSRRRLL